MPTRYLKPGIRDSEAIDLLSPLSEVFYYRLLVTVDDFGRFDARPAMLKSQCFPIREKVTAKNCQELLQELATAGLALVYEVDGKPYLQITKWDNKPRATESKFPQFNDACIQLYADVNNPRTLLPLTVTVTVTKTETKTDNRNASAATATRFDDFWNAWPTHERKQDKAKCAAKWKAEKLDSLIDQITADIAVKRRTDKWQGGYIEAPLVYLNNRRWEDGVQPQSSAPTLSDPYSRAAIEAQGVAKGYGPWDELKEQWPSYKAKVMGVKPHGINIMQLAEMAQLNQRN